MKKSIQKLSSLKLIFLIFLLFEIINFSVLLVSNYFSPIFKLFKFDNSWGIIRAYGNFDGFHYYHIAKEGYGLYQEAFFPLYPVLIKITGFFTNTHFINGLIISNLSFLIFLFIFYIFLEEMIGKNKTIWTILFFVMFPSSFFLVMYYTESLFLLFFILTLYSLKHDKYIFASLFGFLTALTRLIGVFSLIPILIYIVLERKKLDIKNLIVLISPVLGFLTYSSYLYFTTGDFLKFINVQPSFGANRSAEIIILPQVAYRYVKIITTAAFDFTYYVAILEFAIFGIVTSLLLYQLYKLFKKKYSIPTQAYSVLIGLNIFSLINLILPTMSGTFSSIPRYALLSVSLFITLAFVESRKIKYTILIGFLILHLILLHYYYQGFFIS